MSDGEDKHLELVLAFDSDDPEFTRAFEAGQLWERLSRDGWLYQPCAHASNAEMLIRMAESKGLSFKAETINDDWISITIGTPVEQEA